MRGNRTGLEILLNFIATLAAVLATIIAGLTFYYQVWLPLNPPPANSTDALQTQSATLFPITIAPSNSPKPVTKSPTYNVAPPHIATPIVTVAYTVEPNSAKLAVDIYLRSGPNDWDPAITGYISSGTSVELLGRTPDLGWFMIQTKDQKQGWVRKDWVISSKDNASIPIPSLIPSACPTGTKTPSPTVATSNKCTACGITPTVPKYPPPPVYPPPP